MNSVINFVQFENQVISATYRNLMVGARVVLVDVISGDQLASPSPDHFARTQRFAADQAAGLRQARRVRPARPQRARQPRGPERSIFRAP